MDMRLWFWNVSYNMHTGVTNICICSLAEGKEQAHIACLIAWD